MLLRPVKNPDALRVATEDYFYTASMLDSSGSDTLVSDNVRHMLQRLEEAGEDVQRIYEWGRALDPDMLPYSDMEGRHSADLWGHTIGWWRPEELAKLDRPGPDVRDRLYASWDDQVRKPSAALQKRYKLDEDTWLGDATRRSDWDNFLWEKWFKEFEYDPAMVAADGYRQMLFREWWRRIGPTVTPEERVQMMRWHEEGARGTRMVFLNPKI